MNWAANLHRIQTFNETFHRMRLAMKRYNLLICKYYYLYPADCPTVQCRPDKRWVNMSESINNNNWLARDWNY